MKTTRMRTAFTVVAALAATAALAAADLAVSFARSLAPLLLCGAGGLVLAWSLFTTGQGHPQAAIPAVMAAVALWMWALELARRSGARDMAEAVSAVLGEGSK